MTEVSPTLPSLASQILGLRLRFECYNIHGIQRKRDFLMNQPVSEIKGTASILGFPGLNGRLQAQPLV